MDFPRAIWFLPNWYDLLDFLRKWKKTKEVSKMGVVETRMASVEKSINILETTGKELLRQCSMKKKIINISGHRGGNKGGKGFSNVASPF